MTATPSLSTNPLHRVPAYAVRDDVLSQQDVAELLAYALEHEAAFAPTGVGGFKAGKALNREIRVSLAMRTPLFKAWHQRIETSFAPLLPGILAELGMRSFDIAKYEIELVRHNDGDFYRRHIDMHTGPSSKARRAISMVYYFHAEPKAFEGGALRIYSLARNDIFTDVAPEQNRLVAFPSWVPHEVMPIACPSRRFIDSRFAINCWVRQVPAETNAA
ncbi:2OG-Fe(II) oxygenase [Sphingomonas sp. MMS24-J45]|uniref:2OG-Fe(II) oxygenase n=1 Tax=Sphingomonas sp. MMS24-J45 TaxID=3238806 RepID=UPI00384DBD5C